MRGLLEFQKRYMSTSVIVPSKGATTWRFDSISPVACILSFAERTAAFRLSTRESAAAFCFSAYTNSFPATAPGVFAAS